MPRRLPMLVPALLLILAGCGGSDNATSRPENAVQVADPDEGRDTSGAEGLLTLEERSFCESGAGGLDRYDATAALQASGDSEGPLFDEVVGNFPNALYEIGRFTLESVALVAAVDALVSSIEAVQSAIEDSAQGEAELDLRPVLSAYDEVSAVCVAGGAELAPAEPGF